MKIQPAYKTCSEARILFIRTNIAVGIPPSEQYNKENAQETLIKLAAESAGLIFYVNCLKSPNHVSSALTQLSTWHEHLIFQNVLC